MTSKPLSWAPVASVERVPASLLPRRPLVRPGGNAGTDEARRAELPSNALIARPVWARTGRGRNLQAAVRCFVAAWPTQEVVEALANLPRPSLRGLRWSGHDQWHVTLRFFGEIDGKGIEAATASLRQALSGLPARLTAQGGPSTRFLGPGLVIWPVSGLDDAAQAVERATASTGKPPADRKFLGHMTMARAQRGTDLRSARHLLAPLAVRGPVSSLTLVRSKLHPDRTRYQVLEEIPLGATGEQSSGEAGGTATGFPGHLR